MDTTDYIERIPSTEKIQQHLCRNRREVTLLRQLLKIAKQRDQVQEARQQESALCK